MQKNIVNLRTLRRTTGILLVLLAIACALPGISSNDVFAQDGVDSAALAKEIDKNLRAAERDMFSGKNESADQQLQAIAGQIEQLKAVDPGNSKLGSLGSKYERIRKNLDRKLGVTAPAASSGAPAAPPKPTAAAPPTAEAAASEPATPAEAELPRADGRDIAARPAAYHHQIKCLSHVSGSFLYSARRSSAAPSTRCMVH